MFLLYELKLDISAIVSYRPTKRYLVSSSGRQMKITVEAQAREFVRKVKYWRLRRPHKVVLCRPRGGLNDMLCQIDKCRLYSIRHHRDLWIDTSRSGFHDCLSNYFEPGRAFHFGSPIPEVCEGSSCFPRFLAHGLDSYEPVYDSSLDNWVDRETGKPLTFDFGSSYDETVLLHEQCGGGDKSIMTLALLRLKPGIKQRIESIVQSLGKYDAIHVRNTDLTTDYREWFKRLDDGIKGRVVLCTDDLRCQQYAKALWGDRLVEIHDVPDTSGTPLHRFVREEQHALNVDALTDLFVLACAENFHSTRTNRDEISGFGRLADSLRSNPRIIKKLLK
jgi:hypothetical protein